jgi:hypothetical protein
MSKKIIRLTESDLQNIIKKSVNRILKEDWGEYYDNAMEKMDYVRAQEEYDSKKWYQKILAMVQGQRPKDAHPNESLDELLAKYVQAYNKEHGIGHRIEYGNGETFHSAMRHGEDGQPVLTATHYDGNTATQSRKQFDRYGNESELGVGYPTSEFGVTGDKAPRGSHPNVADQYRKFDANREEIRNRLRNR